MDSTKQKNLHFGINDCYDLHNKLKFESDRLENNWNVYDFFNFIITSWHLYNDWLRKKDKIRPKWAIRKKTKIPKEMMQVINATRDLANGSKHMELNDKSTAKKVIDVIHPPEIRDWYSYFIAGPQIGISIGQSYYSMADLRNLIMSYFDWIFDDSVPADNFPSEIKKYLEWCIIIKEKQNHTPTRASTICNGAG